MEPQRITDVQVSNPTAPRPPSAIKEDEMFQDFLKLLGTGSVKRLRNDSVDLQPILYGLLAMGNNHAMNMTDLTAKTYFFLAICGLMRTDDLACIDAIKSKASPTQLELVVVLPKEGRNHQLIIKPAIPPLNRFAQLELTWCIGAGRRTKDLFTTGKHHKLDSEYFTLLISESIVTEGQKSAKRKTAQLALAKRV
ncbi:hypothetical protein DFQ26_009890 [Actinomortierella ambigua]|nr:hypothetical protein DFQ26_009890 [Actinomortierella ambigua]